MKNITLKIDDDTHRKARILAAERGTSISAMVRELLISQTSMSENSSVEGQTSHEKRVSDLDAFFAEMDAKSKTRPPRSEPLIPMTREEIYAERIH